MIYKKTTAYFFLPINPTPVSSEKKSEESKHHSVSIMNPQTANDHHQTNKRYTPALKLSPTVRTCRHDRMILHLTPSTTTDLISRPGFSVSVPLNCVTRQLHGNCLICYT